jgi:hypothetical protein
MSRTLEKCQPSNERRRNSMVNEVCSICNATLTIRVCKSAAGYYLGFICPKDGPYSRASGYLASEEDAKGLLSAWLGGG